MTAAQTTSLNFEHEASHHYRHIHEALKQRLDTIVYLHVQVIDIADGLLAAIHELGVNKHQGLGLSENPTENPALQNSVGVCLSPPHPCL